MAKAGQIGAVLEALTELSDDDDIREWKAALVLPILLEKHGTETFQQVSNAYLNLISSRFPALFDKEALYVDFILLIGMSKTTAYERLTEVVRKISGADFSEAVAQVMDLSRMLEIASRNRLPRTSPDQLSIHEKLYQLHGTATDILISASTVIDFIKKVASFKGGTAITILREDLRTMYNCSSFLNSTDYFIKKVSYGELTVGSVDWTNFHIALLLSDESIDMARAVHIQQALTKRLLKPSERHVCSMFRDIAWDVARGSATLLQDRTGKSINNSELALRLNHILSMLSLEDELILSCAEESSEVLPFYIIAVCLASFVSVFDLAGYPLAVIREDDLKSYLSDYISGESIWNRAMGALTLSVQQSQTIKKPYLRLNGEIICLVPFAVVHNWPLPVRDSLLVGGSFGNHYGRILEDYTASLFVSHGWMVLGKRIGISQLDDNSELDLVVEKNGLILLVQVKNHPECRDLYEYWKAKKKVSKSIDQATLANKHRQSVMKQIKIDSSGKLIKSVVITTSFSDYGTSIPVIDLPTFDWILRGAPIDTYIEGRLTSSRCQLTEQWTCEQFLDILSNPVKLMTATLDKKVIETTLPGVTISHESIGGIQLGQVRLD